MSGLLGPLVWSGLLLLTPACSASVSEMRPLHLQTSGDSALLSPEQLKSSMAAGLARFAQNVDSWSQEAMSSLQSRRWRRGVGPAPHRGHHGAAAQPRAAQGSPDARAHTPEFDLPDELWHSYTYNTGVGNREELSLHGLHGGYQLNVSGPVLDSPPEWQVVYHKGMFYLFGLYPFAGTSKLHIIKTDFHGLFVERTANFSAGDLSATPFLHYIHATHSVQLFLFVKQKVPASSLYETGSHMTEQVFCFLVDQQTLHTKEACTPITLPKGYPTLELLVTTLTDHHGAETVALFPVQESRVLTSYRLQPIAYSQHFSLGLYTTTNTKGSIWRVRVFTVSGRSYAVVVYGQGPLTEMIQVFRYDSGSFTLVQSLAVSNNVIDIEVFGIGFQHYLALGQMLRVSLYKWHGTGFQLLQDEPSPLTYKWTIIPVPSCRHEVVLAKVYRETLGDSTSRHQVQFYIHNVRTGDFDLVEDVPCVSDSGEGYGLDCFRQLGDELSLKHLVSIHTEDTTYVLVPSKLRQMVLVTVNATVGMAKDPVWLENRDLQRRKLALQSQYEGILAKMSRVQAALDGAVVPGSDQHLHGDYSFDGHVNADTIYAPDAAFDHVTLAGFSGDINQMVAPLDELIRKVAALEAAVADMGRRLQDVVSSDDTSLVITGDKTFVGDVTITSLSGNGTFGIESVGGRYLPSALQDIVTVDTDKLINGTKTVRSTLTVVDELTVGQLNGRPVSDIVTTDTIQELSASITYQDGSLSVDSLSVSGLVAGVKPQNLATWHGYGTLPVSVSVGSLTASDLGVVQLNGQTPEDLFSNVLTSQGGNFTQSITFSDVTVGDAAITGTLNGEDAASLLSSVLYTDSAHTIDALWLQDAVVNGSLTAQTVLGRPFPGNYVTRGGSYTFTGSKVFSQLTADTVTAARVDGVLLSELVTLDSDQVISELRVNSAVLIGGLAVGGTVDGVTITPDWLDHVVQNGSQTLTTDLVFTGDVTSLTQLTATDINGGQLESILAQLIVPTSAGITVTGTKQFLGDVTVGSVNVAGLVNGANPANWMTLSTDQLVTGPLTLANTSYFDRLTVLGLIDGVDFDRLWRDAIVVNSEQQQTITGQKVWLNDVTMTSLTVGGTINDIIAGRVLWESGAQHVTSIHTYLGPVRAGLLHAFHSDFIVPENATVGGHDFSELAKISYDIVRNTTHTQTLVFDQLFITDGAAAVTRLNGRPIRELVDSLLPSSGGRVTGNWHFAELCVNGAVTSAFGAGGYHLTDISRRAVTLHSPAALTAPVTFERLLVTSGDVTGLLQLGGVYWEEVLAGLARQGDIVVINGSKTFAGGVHVAGGLFSPSLPLENVLVVNSDQLITASAFFHSDVTIHNDLVSHSDVNGVYDVAQLETLFVNSTSDVTINGDLVFWGATSLGSLSVVGLLGGLPISSIIANAVHLSSSSPVTLTGQLVFTAPVSTTTLRVLDGIVSGRDLVQYLASVRLLTEDQVLTGPVQATQLVLSGGSVQNLHVSGLLNGINVTSLLQDLILLTEDYSFTGLWSLPALTIAGDFAVLSWNDQLPINILRLDSTASHTSLTITGNVYVPNIVNSTQATTLNGLNLALESSALVRLHGPGAFLPAPLNITGVVVFRGDLEVGGLVNGINVSDLVVLGQDTTLLGSYVFSGSVSADHVIVTGLVGGTNITECAAGAVYPDTAATLQGHYNFTWVSVVNNSGTQMTPASLMNTTDTVVSLLFGCVQQFLNFNAFFGERCAAVSQLYDSQRDTYYALRYLDVIQELTWPDLSHVTAVIPLQSASGASLVLVTYTRQSGGCAESQLLQWTSAGDLRRSGAPITGVGAVLQWRHLSVAGAQLLVSAAGPQTDSCPGPLSAVWRWHNGALQLVQDLKVAAAQVSYTEAPHGLATLLLLDPAGDALWRYTYNADSATFVGGPEPSQAELMATRALPDGSLLVVTSADSTVSVSVQTAEYGVQAQSMLGQMTAVSLHTYTVRGRVMVAVGDGGWSSLVNSPQGVKIFEYLGDGTHRCVPAQHLDAVSPSSMAHFTAGSLPDLFMAVVERGCGLRLFIDKGESGFVEVQRLTLKQAESVTVVYPTPGSPPHLLVTAGRYLLLLRAEMMGAHVAPLQADCLPRLPVPQLLT